VSNSLWYEQLWAAGRKDEPIVFSFALSLLLHASVLFFSAGDAARDSSFALGLNLEPASIDVRLVPAPSRPVPEAKLRSEAVRAEEKSLPPPASHKDGTSKSAKSPHATLSRLVDLKTGSVLDLAHWQGAQILGRPIRIRLSINAAGLIANWELLTPGAKSLPLDLEAMNVMVRNMDADRTGETHVLIWESQVGKKGGRLIAKIYLPKDD
jgi:hypothetical protein